MLGIDSKNVVTMVRALKHLAGVDGMAPPEMALISGFYEGTKEESDPLFAEVMAGEDWSDDELSGIDTDEHKDAFLQTCMFLIFADGKVSDEEKTTVKSWASKLSVDDEQLQELFNEVKENFLSNLRNLPQPPAHMDELEAGFTL